jgi:hypothetical protein
MKNKYISVTKAISIYSEYSTNAASKFYNFELAQTTKWYYGLEPKSYKMGKKDILRSMPFIQHLIWREDPNLVTRRLSGEEIERHRYNEPIILFGKKVGETDLQSLQHIQHEIVDKEFNTALGNMKIDTTVSDKPLDVTRNFYRNSGYIFVNNYDYEDRYCQSKNYDCLMDMKSKDIIYTDISIEHKEFWEFMKNTFEEVLNEE